jgi:NAD-dependent deacetylase
MKQHLVVLTGAGMSAESGLKTFRDENGLWEGHDVTKVASPEGFRQNPELVLDFYNQRRRQLKETTPNEAHFALAGLETEFKVSIITQNVDDLHERAGSTNILHLHGELTKVRSTGNPSDIINWTEDLMLGDLCKEGFQLRPHIVWFGESVPMIEPAIDICQQADLLLIIGTSLQVYPAASLMHYTPSQTPTFYIDPKPSLESQGNLTVIPKKASQGILDFKAFLKAGLGIYIKSWCL